MILSKAFLIETDYSHCLLAILDLHYFLFCVTISYQKYCPDQACSEHFGTMSGVLGLVDAHYEVTDPDGGDEQ